MDAEPEPAEPLIGPAGAAFTQEHQQWRQRCKHHFSLIDAHSNRRGEAEYTATETFRERNRRRLVARQYTYKRTKNPPRPHVHAAPPRAQNARNMQDNRPRFDSLRRAKDSAVQKLRRAKNTAVNKLRLAKDTTLHELRLATNATVSNLGLATNTTIDSLRMAKNTTVDSLRWMGNRADRLVPPFPTRPHNLDIALIGIDVALAIALVYTNHRAAHYQALLAIPTAGRRN